MSMAKRLPKTIHGYPVVQRERDALLVWDLDADEAVDYAPGHPWSIRTSKWLREHGTGHRCVYLGFAPTISTVRAARACSVLTGRPGTRGRKPETAEHLADGLGMRQGGPGTGQDEFWTAGAWKETPEEVYGPEVGPEVAQAQAETGGGE